MKIVIMIMIILIIMILMIIIINENYWNDEILNNIINIINKWW